jgi:peptidoglycan hydrolase-like protein with peptidoglycan-binding domain/3D (Asp-Asp-Asp) domain-containing protein
VVRQFLGFPHSDRINVNMKHKHRLTNIFLCAMFTVTQLLVPANLIAKDPLAPYEQDFVITAYYSPEESQCCYIRGSFGGDIALNGEGHHGADGSEVFAGMAAGPKSYAFGTTINLPGLGIVAVHDRGGAIKNLQNGSDRLDLWVGSGEEGLARALAFGVRRVRGTVYPNGSIQPKVAMDLTKLEAPLDVLRAFKAEDPLLVSLDIHKDDRSLSVKIVQEKLKKIGYFEPAVNGVFGDQTEAAITAFQKDFGLENEKPGEFTPLTAATLSVLSHRPSEDPGWLQADGLSMNNVPSLKRALRLLGYYKGRTNHDIDAPQKDAIVGFQLAQGIIGSPTDQYAGSFGPKTKAALKHQWLATIVASQSQKILFAYHVRQMIAEKGLLVEDFLAEGDKGDQVKRLQKFLADKGFIAKERVTGVFGAETEKALIAYQISAKIVDSHTSKGAGFAGPATLAQVRHDIEQSAVLLVKANGWSAL